MALGALRGDAGKGPSVGDPHQAPLNEADAPTAAAELPEGVHNDEEEEAAQQANANEADAE